MRVAALIVVVATARLANAEPRTIAIHDPDAATTLRRFVWRLTSRTFDEHAQLDATVANMLRGDSVVIADATRADALLAAFWRANCARTDRVEVAGTSSMGTAPSPLGDYDRRPIPPTLKLHCIDDPRGPGC